MTARTIRTVSDLAELPDQELGACLRALRLAIQQTRQLHHDAVASGMLVAAERLAFDQFVWNPKASYSSASEAKLTAETPLSDLNIRPSARQQLAARNVFCLEDLTAVTELELRSCKHIGLTTITRLREMLVQVGLEFAQHPEPEAECAGRSARLSKLPESTRWAGLKGLPDDAAVTRLNLSHRTVARAEERGLRTVGDVRSKALWELGVLFGPASLKELYRALQATGTGLRNEPTPLQLWKAGLMDAADLERPSSDDTPVRELQPWLGNAVRHLQRSGMSTLGDLLACVKRRGLGRIAGLARRDAERVLDFFSMPALDESPVTVEVPSKPATSVFGLASVAAAGD